MNYGGHSYCIIVDRFSSWISVYKVNNLGAEQLIKILRHHFETYRASEELASDGGLGYVAASTQAFLKLWGCKHRLSSAYFPHSGYNDKFVQQMYDTMTRITKDANRKHIRF